MKLRSWNRLRKRIGNAVEALEDKKLLAADLLTIESTTDGIALTFSEPVSPGPGTGNIVLSDAADGSLIEVINVNSDQASFADAVVTIDPSVSIAEGTTVAVSIDAGAVISGTETASVDIFSEDFEGVELENSLLVPRFDDYVAVFTGILDVQVAGDYTFGINSDDGQTLAIDLDQDGLDFIDDEIIYDDTTHGRQDRLSTCGATEQVQSCEGFGQGPITLEVGQYEFGFFYFDRSGGSGGEFFYGPGNLEVWDADAFAIVGDASKGIGVVDGITVTTYKEVPGATVGNLQAAEALIEDEDTIIGSEVLEFADVAENPGGRFSHDNAVPGAADWALANDENPFDYSNEGPLGWTNDNSDLIEGGAPEYNGWVWLDKEFWIAEQGDQSRTNFELGSGTLLVADPDAHDDYVDNGGQNQAACLPVLEFGPECGLFTASVDVATVYLNGVAENSLTLEFASSWWDEDTQSAEVRVQYFDAAGEAIGEPNVILRWESIPDSPNFKPVEDPDTGADARNELLTYDLENPAGAASAVVTFDMPYATNDWWWAIDNVVISAEVTGELAPAASGEVVIVDSPEGPSNASVGDFNSSGVIDFSDFLIVSSNFGKEGATPEEGDADGNGTVNFQDFLVVSANFNKTYEEVVDAMMAEMA